MVLKITSSPSVLLKQTLYEAPETISCQRWDQDRAAGFETRDLHRAEPHGDLKAETYTVERNRYGTPLSSIIRTVTGIFLNFLFLFSHFISEQFTQASVLIAREATR